MTLSYRVVGNGDPLLLIHGMGVTYSIWENLVPLLSPYYKLIMVELPGHGCSPTLPEQAPYYAASADELEAIRRELDIERWHVLAYSVGTWVAQAYRECYPERIQDMIFLCPAVLSLVGRASLRNVIWLDRHLPVLGNWMLSSWRLHTLVCLLGFGSQNHPYASLWTHEISAQPVELMKRLLVQMPATERANFQLTTSPVLMLWARRDAISARPRQLRPFDRLIPGHHSAPLLSAQTIAEEVLAFACA